MTTLSNPNLTDNPPVESLAYETALVQLEEIVAALESGEHSLDATLSMYARGQALAVHCAALLDQAELKVRQLSGEKLAGFDNQI